MKRIIGSFMALLLLASGGAFAAPQQHDNRGHDDDRNRSAQRHDNRGLDRHDDSRDDHRNAAPTTTATNATARPTAAANGWHRTIAATAWPTTASII